VSASSVVRAQPLERSFLRAFVCLLIRPSIICGYGLLTFDHYSMQDLCKHGGWQLGHLVDGAHAEYFRMPYAYTSLYHVPPGVDERGLLVVSDTLPTGLEVGAIRGNVRPGCTVAIVGAGTFEQLPTTQREPSLMIVQLTFRPHRSRRRPRINPLLPAQHNFPRPLGHAPRAREAHAPRPKHPHN